jgi:hypothetical protein
MKNIEIKGKHQKHKIDRANDPNNKNIVATRDCMQTISPEFFLIKNQISMINKLYLNSEKEFEYKKECLREIDKKIASYKAQDINKNKYEENNITQEQTIEKLVCSKLKCYYCSCNMFIFYNKVRDSEQWTLDRIDNDLPHQNNNVIVCCLRCNLQRRRQNKDKFLFTKQLKIVKVKENRNDNKKNEKNKLFN